MTREERNNKLKHFITCMKCEVSGKCCDENCPIQYEAGNMGEIIENLEEISKILEQGMTYGYCVYHERECDYKGNCVECPYNTIEDAEWFRRDEEQAKK